jgi:hypothetical protein
MRSISRLATIVEKARLYFGGTRGKLCDFFYAQPGHVAPRGCGRPSRKRAPRTTCGVATPTRHPCRHLLSGMEQQAKP